MPELPYTRETELVTDVVQLLLALGIPAIRVNAGAMKTEKGFYRSVSVNGCSDVLACLPEQRHIGIGQIWAHTERCGTFAAIECKVGTRKVTPEQQAFLDAITRAGGVAIVARSLEDVEEMLESVGIDPRKANV